MHMERKGVSPRGLKDIANDVNALALRSPLGRPRDQLFELELRLTKTHAAELVNVNLAEEYAPDVVLPSGPDWFPPVATGVELLRDLLIFVPIAYTWWKISIALEAYNSYTGAAPFLLAWQQGFDQGSEPLSSSASVIAGVVTLIIVLTLVANLIRELPDVLMARRRAQLAEYLREAKTALHRSLTRDATDVSVDDLRMLGGKITESSRALQKALTESSKDITTSVNTSPGSKLHEMFENWTKAATELTVLGSRLQGTQEVVVQLAAAQNELRAMVLNIGTTTGQLVAALTTERNLSRQEAHAHHEVATRVAESTTKLSESLTDLHSRTDDLNRMINRMVYVVERLEP